MRFWILKVTSQRSQFAFTLSLPYFGSERHSTLTFTGDMRVAERNVYFISDRPLQNPSLHSLQRCFPYDSHRQNSEVPNEDADRRGIEFAVMPELIIISTINFNNDEGDKII